MFLCFMYFLTLFYFWAIRSHDRQVEINTYLLTYLMATVRVMDEPCEEQLLAPCCNLLLASCRAASKTLDWVGAALQRLGDSVSDLSLTADDWTLLEFYITMISRISHAVALSHSVIYNHWVTAVLGASSGMEYSQELHCNRGGDLYGWESNRRPGWK